MGITAAEVIAAERGTIVFFSQPAAILAAALAGRRKTNGNKATKGRKLQEQRLESLEDGECWHLTK